MNKVKRKRYKWDAFICHASEDKKAVVEPLFHELCKYGLKVWFDKFSIKVGDSLRQKIDNGLANSRFGIVVFSPSFFSKKVAQSELDGLFSREATGTKKVILPIWHQVDEEFVREQAATLVGKWAAKTSDGIPEIAKQLIEIIKPKALSLETSHADAERAGSRLLTQLQKGNRALNFSVSIGQGVETQSTSGAGLIASIFRQNMRIDVLAKDVEEYMKAPLQFSVSLAGEGIRKFQEFVRTGRSQEISGDELRAFTTSLEMSGLGFTEMSGGRLVLKTAISSKKIPVCVTFGSGASAVIVPYMESYVERAGADELCLLTKATDMQFTLRTTIPLNRVPINQELTFDLKLESQEIHVVRRYFRAALALQQAGTFEIKALQTDSVILRGAAVLEEPSESDLWYAKIMDDVVLVADKLGLEISWPEVLKEEDIELLAYLKALVEKRPVATEGHFTATWTKSTDSLRHFDSSRSGVRFASVREEPLSFLGAMIPSGTIALVANACVDDFEMTRQQLESAAIGQVVDIKLKLTSPLFISLWDRNRSCPKD
jgi:TIR domain